MTSCSEINSNFLERTTPVFWVAERVVALEYYWSASGGAVLEAPPRLALKLRCESCAAVLGSCYSLSEVTQEKRESQVVSVELGMWFSGTYINTH